MNRIVFITGGARSGKSAFAQRLAESSQGHLLYLAAARIEDSEMAERVSRHQAMRGERWHTIEEPLRVTAALAEHAVKFDAVLFDCVTLWLSNLLLQHQENEEQILAEVDELTILLPDLPAPIFLVSNEVGCSVVPENRLARRFRDLAGLANQRLAAAADEAWLVAAGLPLQLK